MRKVRLFNDIGQRFRFKQEMSDASVSQVLRAEEVLGKVIRPAALVMGVSLFDRKFHNPHVTDDTNYWLFVSKDTDFEYRKILNYYGKEPEIVLQEEAVPSSEWARSRMNQPISSEYYYGISSGRVYAGWGRISKQSYGETILLYDRHNHNIPIPIYSMDNRRWVFGPDDKIMMYPPIFYEISNNHGYLNLDIWVSWQNAWEDVKTEEYKLLKQVMEDLVELGWSYR